MSPVIWILTVVLLAIPVLMVAVDLPIIGLALAILYLWVWLWMRPRHFTVDESALVIVWPFRSRRIERDELRSVRIVSAREFRQTYGFAIRVGIGGLWGGFGLLWTRSKSFQMYVSRTDGLVILERDNGRSLLITPERPEEFARTISKLFVASPSAPAESAQ